MNRAPRVKWHMLRRRKADAPFLRANLDAALRAGAACEVDIVLTSDGHAVCLHDLTLDRETTGRGRVADCTRAQIEALRQRAPDGVALAEPPLFLDEVAAAAARIGAAALFPDEVAAAAARIGAAARFHDEVAAAPALIQIDVKVTADALNTVALDHLRAALGDHGSAFIASGAQWLAVQRLVAAVPGLHAGFDPLAFYPRTMHLDADGFRAVAARTLATAPGAAMYYLEAKLILAALDRDVDLIALLSGGGARIDAWTIDADLPGLHAVLRRLIAARCYQITSNDPEILTPLIAQLLATT